MHSVDYLLITAALANLEKQLLHQIMKCCSQCRIIQQWSWCTKPSAIKTLISISLKEYKQRQC